jgi:small multidrug resistance pump
VEYLYLAIAILAEVGATLALKASDALTHPMASTFVLIGYVIAYYFLSLALRALPLAFAYATWACVGTILMTLLSRMVFKQPLDSAGVLGISIMLIGTVILNGFSSSPH